MRFPSDPASLAILRDRVRDWLHAAGAERDVAHDLVLATVEAATNAIEHSGSRAHFEVELAVVGASARIVVRDFGRWDDSQVDPDFGRGLFLIEALTERHELRSSDSGTTIAMWRRLSDRARRGARSAGPSASSSSSSRAGSWDRSSSRTG